MKRYMIFAYDHYYPSGGMSDFQTSVDTIEEVRDWSSLNGDTWDVIDIYDIVEDKSISL